MELDKFLHLTENFNYIPVYERITADLLTPALAFLKLRKNLSFIFESVESEERIGRYSFIGIEPAEVFFEKDGCVYRGNENLGSSVNFFDFLKILTNEYKQPKLLDLPSFKGGLVGYIGYEAITKIEATVVFNYKLPDYPIIYFGQYDEIIAFDHFKREIVIIANADLKKIKDPLECYSIAKKKIKKIKNELSSQRLIISSFVSTGNTEENLNKEEFVELVKKSKKEIAAGEIFQIVLSKKFYKKYDGDLFNVYRALRIINPSPYMFYMNCIDEMTILGASPENLIRVIDGKAETMPIAGTRKRGASYEEDLELERDLVSDKKEKAEHVMLVDLGRNDLGKVCEYGTVRTFDLMKVYRYSHVMHMISRVEGKLRKDMDSLDALAACFPAGTVSGAPKIRAMQLITEFENCYRGVYAGAIGYYDFSKNMDFCIAIRTFIAKNNLLLWQAGAGIVADSYAENEHEEIKNKALALEKAINLAEKIYENFND